MSEAVWENVRFQMLRAKALLSGDSAPGLAAGRELLVGSCHFLQMNVVLTKPPFAHALENHRYKRKKKNVCPDMSLGHFSSNCETSLNHTQLGPGSKLDGC